MELGKRRVESVEVKAVPEERVLTAEEEPVLSLSLRAPALEGDAPQLRRIGRGFARQARAWRARWEGPLYAMACAARQAAREQSRPFTPWTAELDFTVTRSGGGLLSLRTDAAERHGAARPLLVRSGETWDLSSGVPVPLSALFPARRWRRQVRSAVAEQCARRASSGEFLFYEDWPRRAAADFDPDNFYLTEDTLVIFYPLHTLCPAAEGIPEFFLPLPV